MTVVSGGSPLSPTYTIAAGSTTCNIPLSVLNGVDTFSISVLSKGDGNLNLDSDPISTQTWDLRLKFGYDSVAKCIKAVWSGMNTPAQLTVTEDKADAPGLYTFNSLSESFVELKWDNTALDLGGKTWAADIDRCSRIPQFSLVYLAGRVGGGYCQLNFPGRGSFFAGFFFQ